MELEKKVKLIADTFRLVFLARRPCGNIPAQESPIDAAQYRKVNLTKRESEVLRLVSVGMSNLQVAETLFISEHTVKLHVSSILKKLKLENRTQLAIYGIRVLQ